MCVPHPVLCIHAFLGHPVGIQVYCLIYLHHITHLISTVTHGVNYRNSSYAVQVLALVGVSVIRNCLQYVVEDVWGACLVTKLSKFLWVIYSWLLCKNKVLVNCLFHSFQFKFEIQVCTLKKNAKCINCSLITCTLIGHVFWRIIVGQFSL